MKDVVLTMAQVNHSWLEFFKLTLQLIDVVNVILEVHFVTENYAMIGQIHCFCHQLDPYWSSPHNILLQPTFSVLYLKSLQNVDLLTAHA